MTMRRHAGWTGTRRQSTTFLDAVHQPNPKGAVGFMRHPFLLAAAIAVCTLFVGCSTGPGPAGQGNYATVFGTVTASATGKPIAGAKIVISLVVTIFTDANGVYRETGVPIDSPGIDETVTASANGYQPQTKSVHVAAAGQQYEVDFQLASGS